MQAENAVSHVIRFSNAKYPISNGFASSLMSDEAG